MVPLALTTLIFGIATNIEQIISARMNFNTNLFMLDTADNIFKPVYLI